MCEYEYILIEILIFSAVKLNMAQVRNKSRLDRVVAWFKKEMPEKFYEFEKPPHPALMPYPWAYQYINKPIVRWIERQGVHFYNTVVNKMEMGLYPKEWNPRIHGIYCHWRYYGTNTDIPVWDVKIKDLKKWFARRNYNPRAMWSEFSRWWYKFTYDYYKGPLFTNPIEHIFMFIFHFMFANWLIRNILLGQKEHMREAIYHW